jgi:hypothetical protein
MQISKALALSLSVSFGAMLVIAPALANARAGGPCAAYWKACKADAKTGSAMKDCVQEKAAADGAKGKACLAMKGPTTAKSDAVTAAKTESAAPTAGGGAAPAPAPAPESK